MASNNENTSPTVGNNLPQDQSEKPTEKTPTRESAPVEPAVVEKPHKTERASRSAASAAEPKEPKEPKATEPKAAEPKHADPKTAETKPAAAPEPAAPPVDMARLLDFANGDSNNLRELVELYISQTSGQVQQLLAAA